MNFAPNTVITPKRCSLNEESLASSSRKVSSPLLSPFDNIKITPRYPNTAAHKSNTLISGYHPRGSLGFDIRQPTNHNNVKVFIRKPLIATYIDDFIMRFYGLYKENFGTIMKNIVEIEREKYETRKNLGMKNLDENIEVDLIFNEENCSFYFFI